MVSHDDEIERFPSGAVANQETGRPTGLEVVAERTSGAGRWQLRSSRWNEPVAYSGRTQIGFPVSTTTELRWQDLRIAIDVPLRGGDGLEARGGASLGWRRIHRDIQPALFATRLTETLQMQPFGLA